MLYFCKNWQHDPLDVAVVNRMTCEDLNLVDSQHQVFDLHCATQMSPEQIHVLREDALAIGVNLIRYHVTNGNIDIEPQMGQMDIVVGHYPQTHEHVLNCSKYMHDKTKRIFFIHAAGDAESFKKFSKRLVATDYIYCTSEEIRKKCSNWLQKAIVRVYIPHCPLEMIPINQVLEDDTRETQPQLELLTYCSGLSLQPEADYKIDELKTAILGMKEKTLWKIVTSKEDVMENIDKHIDDPNNNIKIEYHTRTTLTDLYQEDICNSTYWAMPSLTQRRLSRLDLVFALGSGIPILTHFSKQELIDEIKEFMNVTDELNHDVEFGSVSSSLDHDSLHQTARRVLKHYLLDTKAAKTHKQFVETLLGKLYLILLFN